MMEQIKFDFNNMFSFNVGEKHGVTDAEISAMSEAAGRAHQHLSKLSDSPSDRVNLGLEWMGLPFQDRQTISEIKQLADVISRYENVIFLGIGGSYLGIKAAQDALCPAYFNEFNGLRKGAPRIYFEGNNLDPGTLNVLLKNLNPERTFVIVISKSGETAETKVAFIAAESWLKKHIGKNYGRHIAAITDPVSGSLRKKVNTAQEKDKLSFRSLPLLKGVGGRFSELNMGLLHLAIAGVDIQKVLDGAGDIAKRCREQDLFNNPAYMYALLHTILYRNKNKSIAVLMPFSEALKSTADWYSQLLAESLGKKYARLVKVNPDRTEEWLRDKQRLINVGRTPIACRGTNDLHSLQQNNIEGENNKVVTFVRVEKFDRDIRIPGKADILSNRKFSELLKLAQEATQWALARESRPNCTIIMPEVSAYHWGALIYFFEMATAFEGELLEINAFDQPGVEGYKNYIYYKLQISGRHRGLPLQKPGMTQDIAYEIKNNPVIKKEKYVI